MTEDDRTGAASRGLGPSPYPGLAPYSETDEDAELFFGRDSETRLVLANFVASRLTVLYGPSGVGKSSILRAGVLHRLRADRAHDDDGPQSIALVVDRWRDAPARAIVQAVADEAARRGAAPPPSGVDEYLTLDESLARWSEHLDARLLIVLDQFEDYFLYHPPDTEPLDYDLPAAVDRIDLRVRFLLALREDALAGLDRFEGRGADVFENRLRLEPLSWEAAERAIRGPVERYNDRLPAGRPPATLDADLPETVLSLLRGGVRLATRGRGDVGGTGGDVVEPSHLQLVMGSLWRREAAAGSTVLRTATLRSMGGVTEIMRGHVDRAVGSLGGPGQRIAARSFHFLVTPSGAKISHSADDLAGYADQPVEKVEPVRERLADGDLRILRRVPPPVGTDGPSRYEVFHDVLCQAILDWRARYVTRRMARRAALVMAALIAGGLVLILAASGAVNRLERRTVDARFALRGDQPRDPRVAIVAMDGPTVRALGTKENGRPRALPLRRRDHARMMDILRRAGARAVVYDIEFDEAHFDTDAEVREDQQLTDAIDRARRRLVLASFIFNAEGRGILLGGPAPDDVTTGYDGVLQDPDGRLRKIEYAVHGPGGAGEAFKTMPAAAVALARRGSEPFSQPAWIDYRGREGSFETLSFKDVLARPALARGLRGKVVIVGATTDADRHRTPAGGGSEMSGPEVQANAISTLLRGRPLRDTGPVLAALIMALLGAVTIALVWRRPRFSAVSIPGLVLAYLAAAALLFSAGDVVPVVRPVLVVVLAAAGALVLRLSWRRRQRVRRPPAAQPTEHPAATARTGVPASV